MLTTWQTLLLNFKDPSLKTLQLLTKRNQNHRWCTLRLFMVNKLKVQRKNFEKLDKNCQNKISMGTFCKTKISHVKTRIQFRNYSKDFDLFTNWFKKVPSKSHKCKEINEKSQKL